VGGEDLAKKIQDEGWFDFDRVVAAPDMMGVVGPLGRVLGPRSLMPSPRAGTVTPDVAKAVEEYKAGKVEFRNDSGGNVHAVLGRLSFTPEQIQENVSAFLKYIESLKPSSVKGTYVKNIALTSTMGPGIPLAA
jgi:large subunit ribosomal protein L1